MSKNNFHMDWATRKATKYACENWHYAGCVPAAKLLRVGAWEDNKFIGVIVFGRGTNINLGPEFGLDGTTCVELTRIAMRKHKTPISKMIKIAIKFLRKLNPGLRLIVSYAAQSEGHIGTIYQAANWIYVGPTKKTSEFTFRGKRMVNRSVGELVKKLQKPRRELEKMGIIKRRPAAAKHKYILPLDREMRKQVMPLSKKYPKETPIQNKECTVTDNAPEVL